MRIFINYTCLFITVLLLVTSCQKYPEVLTENEMDWLEAYNENDTVVFENDTGLKKELIVEERQLESYIRKVELGRRRVADGHIRFNSEAFTSYNKFGINITKKNSYFSVKVSGEYVIREDSQYITPQSFTIDSKDYNNVYKISKNNKVFYYHKKKGYLQLRLDTNRIPWNLKRIK